MSRILLSRLAGKKNPPSCRRPFSSSSVETLIAGEPPIPSPPPPHAAHASRSRTLLMISASAVVAAAIGTVGYATYAYDINVLERNASSLQEVASHFQSPDRASGLEKFQDMVYSTAIKVPLKTIELYIDARRWMEENVRGFTEPSSEVLLPDLHPQESHVFTLVLDLNETLVYSDWKRERGWRTFKRPGVDAFLEHLAKFYEIVIYSDQLSMYVDPIIERLDQKGCIRYRLSRNATRYQDGKHYRDLSKLNRDPSRVLYISGNALESSLQHENCVAVKPWKLENDDTALLDIIPFLEYVAVNRPADIRPVLASYQGHDIATEFIERSKEHQRACSLLSLPSVVQKKGGGWKN